jgi:hypothetical protein
MSDDEESVDVRYDAAIEPAIEALQNFARLQIKDLARNLNRQITTFAALATRTTTSRAMLILRLRRYMFGRCTCRL